MQKIFYPDIEYNRKRRGKLLTFYVLLMLFPGGFMIYMLATGNMVLVLFMAFLMIFLFALIPSTLAQYPTKKKPMITVEGKSVTFGDKDFVRIADVISVDVCIDVPPVSKIAAENEEYLKKVAAVKPEQPLTGACDVTVRNSKGKEEIKYSIVADSVGALEALVEAGVRKYRIIYSMKKSSEYAGYKIGAPGEERASELSEKEKIMQLL